VAELLTPMPRTGNITRQWLLFKRKETLTALSVLYSPPYKRPPRIEKVEGLKARLKEIDTLLLIIQD
jgi:hypothetical protein